MRDAAAERLQSFLGREWTAPILHLDTVGSTNDHAKDLARAGAPAFSVVVADEQTAGRGRLGHTWASPPGNLYLSLVLRPQPAAHGGWALLPLAAGVAIAEGLERWGLAVRLKWPNDVLAGGRKLGGILVEAASAGAALDFVIVGVGINVKPAPQGDSAVLPGDATWIARECEARGEDAPEPLAVGAAFLARMAVWYHALAREGGSALLAAWRARSLPWWGSVIEARSGDTVLRGLARRLADDGGLVVEQADGREVILHSGEVREVRASGR